MKVSLLNLSAHIEFQRIYLEANSYIYYNSVNMIVFRHCSHSKVWNASGVFFQNVSFYSHPGFSYWPLLLLTLATTALIGKVQFTCMVLRIMTGYLIVIKILWNYGKLIFHAHSDYTVNNNTTALACPLDFFYFSQLWWHFCSSGFPSY